MRKIVRTTAVSAAAVAAVLSTTVAPASAEEAASPSIALAGPVTAGKGSATVPVVYTCFEPSHVWSALKQGEGVQEDPSSETNPNLTSFYDTNWKVDAGPNALRCDGKERRQTLVLKESPWFAGGEPLSGSTALLQLCLTSDNAFVWNATGTPPQYPMVPVLAAR